MPVISSVEIQEEKMTALIIGAGVLLLGFVLMATGVRLGQQIQKESCGCDTNSFERDSECACGGSCGCDH